MSTSTSTAGALVRLRHLAPFLRPYRRTVYAALLALCAAAAALLALPLAVGRVIDAGLDPAQGRVDDRYFLLLAMLALLAGLLVACRFYLVSWLGERVVADLRTRVFRHVLDLPATFFETARTGELLSRLTTDTTLIQNVVGSSVSIALRSSLTLLGGLLMLLVTSPRLSALIVLVIPLVVLPVLVWGRRVRRLSRTSQDRVADTAALAGEVLNAMPLIQAFTLEAHMAGRYAARVAAAFGEACRRIRGRAVLTAWAIAAVFAGLIAVLWRGAHAVAAGDLSAGALTQFLLYALFVGGSTAALAEVWGALQQAAGAAERLAELLATPPAPRAAHAPRLPARPRGALCFEHVRFAYPSRPTTSALRDFTLDIAAGETVALVGPSGAGKTTVLRLVLAFHQPGAGRILFDGQPFTSLDPHDLRSHLAIVPQEPVLFATTVAENIRLGRPTASDADIQAAATAALADDFIRALPAGYDTPLGERGLRLSGGQQQRIAIARALLRDPAVLLLDEATSALDAENEAAVQAALARLMHRRTTLVVAHRLATVRAADRIVVMDQGRIVASGTHDELIAAGGLYARFASLQFVVGAAERSLFPPTMRLTD